MTDDNPLDRRLSNADAAQLLLAATPATATGATMLASDTDAERPEIIAGFALVPPESHLGAYIVSQGHRTDTWDNQTRWTMIDSGPTAKIVLEIEEVTSARYAIWKGVLSFEYPEDRHALAVASSSGWIAISAGSPDNYHTGDTTKDIGELMNISRGERDPLFAVELSTHTQLREMLRIMDSRNPVLEPIPPEEIVAGIERQIETQREHIAKQQARLDEPVELTQAVKDNLIVKVKEALDRLEAEGKVERKIVDGEESYRAIQTPDGLPNEDPRWMLVGRLVEDPQTRANLEMIMGPEFADALIESRLDAALDSLIADGLVVKAGDTYVPIGPGSEKRKPRTRDELLRDPDMVNWLRLATDDDLGEALPSRTWERTDMDTGEITYIDDKRMKQQSEAAALAYQSLLHKKTPVWAGARGFALAYEEMMRRVRIFREIGSNADQLTILHCQVAISMFESHVLTVGSKQVNALPKLEEAQALSFLRGTPLPFNPFFIDFSGDDELPSMESFAARGGSVQVLGVLCSTQQPEPTELYLTPIFLYTSVDPPYATEPVALGSLIVDLTGDPGSSYYWVGIRQEFTADSVVCVAWSPLLDRAPQLAQEYGRMIMAGAGDAIAVMNLIDYSNVEIVERTLERRERKRVEKRNWNVPMVVRVSRPSRRVVRGESDGMADVEWTHQWDVIGHPKHFAKVGPMTRCIVCAGKTNEKLPCPRCHGTGLDPEKVEPCTRIDLKTGELTCPNGCRRIWCPPHVKGPEDKEYIPKARKLS